MQMTISELKTLIDRINHDLANSGYSEMGPKHIFGYVYSQLLLYIEEKKFDRFDLKKAKLFLLERARVIKQGSYQSVMRSKKFCWNI